MTLWGKQTDEKEASVDAEREEESVISTGKPGRDTKNAIGHMGKFSFDPGFKRLPRT